MKEDSNSDAESSDGEDTEVKNGLIADKLRKSRLESQSKLVRYDLFTPLILFDLMFLQFSEMADAFRTVKVEDLSQSCYMGHEVINSSSSFF
jgi:hypothetical protein